MMRFLILIITLFVFGGCVPKPVVQPASSELSLALPQYTAKESESFLVVLGVRTPNGIAIESDKVYYVDTQGMRRTYAFHRWEGGLARQLHERLVLAIAQSQMLKDVAKQGENIKPDWILETEVLEFAQKMQDENSAIVQFTGRMRLVDAHTQEGIDQRLVGYKIPMQDLGAPQVVDAFNRVVSMWLDETLIWIEKIGEDRYAR
jgi:ABC-type uncharacterized transport system auxiliary subunit